MKSEINLNKPFDIKMHVGRKLDDVERDLIMSTLARCGGNRTWAAEILGLTLRTLRTKLADYKENSTAPTKSNLFKTEAVVEASPQPEEDNHLALLSQFEPGRRLPS